MSRKSLRQWPFSGIEFQCHQVHFRQPLSLQDWPSQHARRPPSQGRFSISPSDTLGGRHVGALQVRDRERIYNPDRYYLDLCSSISPHHMDENSGAHQCDQLLQPIPNGRLIPKLVRWWNLWHRHALPAQMSLKASQNNEIEGTRRSVSDAVAGCQRHGIYQLYR